MTWKPQLAALLRRLHLAAPADRLRYRYFYLKNRAANRAFNREHPGTALPPDYLMYESFQLDYRKYYEGGRNSTVWLKETLTPFVDWPGIRLLDWGCGPARILRHWPFLLPSDAQCYGTDYNTDTIVWCRDHLPGIIFWNNELAPPLPSEADFFNLVYGLSIFTHLSEKMHPLWLRELMRVLQPGGVLLLSTQGDAYRQKLTPAEIKSFDAGQLVVRGQVKEGHRVFSAFHPSAYMRELFAPYAEVLLHIPGQAQHWGIEQDVWVVRKLSE